MYLKLFIQVLCLSLTLIQIKAYVRLPEHENEMIENREFGPKEVHEQHHHKCHHKQHSLPRAHSPSPPPPPGYDIIYRMLPLLANRENIKNGKFEATSDAKLETNSKARAYVVSKWKTRTNEMSFDQKDNNNSKVLTRNIDQSGETDAIIELNSDLDLISDKVMKAIGSQESKPMPPKHQKSEHHSEHRHSHNKHENQNKLNRFRRQAETGGAHDESGHAVKQMGKAFEKAGQVIKEAYEKHAAPFFKDAAQKISQFFTPKKGAKAPGGTEGAPEAHSEEKPHNE